MNTFNNVLLSALTLLLSSSVSTAGIAQNTPPDNRSVQKSFAVALFPARTTCKLWLCLEKYKPADRISVELVDQRGQVLHREVLPAKGGQRNGFRQQFDMSQVGDGNYAFRVSNGVQTEQIPFTLSTPVVEEPVPARLISMN